MKDNEDKRELDKLIDEAIEAEFKEYEHVIDYLTRKPKRLQQIICKYLRHNDMVALSKDKILELESIIGQEITHEPQDRSTIKEHLH
jgi:hypothetical protein